MHVIEPLYSVGEFVCCDYSSILLYTYYDNDIHDPYFYGIIVEVDFAYYEYMDEYVYEVLCLDGVKRFFMESELRRI